VQFLGFLTILAYIVLLKGKLVITRRLNGDEGTGGGGIGVVAPKDTKVGASRFQKIQRMNIT
jgi:hypothetical protein